MKNYITCLSFSDLNLVQMQSVKVYSVEIGADMILPYFEQGVKAGFPSPAEDYRAESINLTKLLIRNPASTEIAIVDEDVSGGGYNKGDILIVVKGLSLKDGCQVILLMEGEQYIYTYRRQKKLQFFEDEQGNIINDISECVVYAVITYVIYPIFPTYIRRVEKKIDINKMLIKYPPRTFITRADGNSMIDKRFSHDDLMVVEKGRELMDGYPVVAYLDEEFCMKTFRKDQNSENYLLEPANPDFETIVVTPANRFIIWGIIIYIIHKTY